jgi:hypothetical protein
MPKIFEKLPHVLPMLGAVGVADEIAEFRRSGNGGGGGASG